MVGVMTFVYKTTVLLDDLVLEAITLLKPKNLNS